MKKTSDNYKNKVHDFNHKIDPGFINKRKLFSFLPNKYHQLFDSRKKNTGIAFTDELYNDHLLVELCLARLKEVNAKSIDQFLHNPEIGILFCGTNRLAGNKNIFNSPSTKKLHKNKLLPIYDYDKEIFLEFHTAHLVSDTGKVLQTRESILSIVGVCNNITNHEIIIHPIIMGQPIITPKDSNDPIDLWHNYEHYNIYPEDIDEFSKIKKVPDPPVQEWISYMENIPENEIKIRLCEIINIKPKKDWGGEINDLYTSSLHINSKRLHAAFLLKGPSKFKEMVPCHLGKNADQIYRLSMSPANILIIQHSHEIGEAVHATLRAFAVAPHNPRYYCMINGKDTYKILKTYNKLK